MGFFDSSSTTTSQTEAYGPAKGYMDAAIGNLGGQQYYNYGGPWYASMNPMMSGAIGAGYDMGQGMMGTFSPYMAQGMGGYADQLSAMQNLGPSQFRFDQGLANQLMDSYMPGLQSSAALQGKLSSRALDSQLGQLMGAAGTSGQFGSSLSSKLSQGAASASALSQEALQGNIQNMYMNARNAANQAGMTAGGRNMDALNANRANLLSGYGNMANMGMRGAMAGLGAMQDAGRTQFGYDQYKTQAGLDQYNANLFGQQQFYANQLNPLANVGQMFGKNTSTTTQSPSMMQNLGSIAGLAGSIYGGFGGMGGGLGSLFGTGDMGGGANIYNNPYYTGNF